MRQRQLGATGRAREKKRMIDTAVRFADNMEGTVRCHQEPETSQGA